MAVASAPARPDEDTMIPVDTIGWRLLPRWPGRRYEDTIGYHCLAAVSLLAGRGDTIIYHAYHWMAVGSLPAGRKYEYKPWITLDGSWFNAGRMELLEYTVDTTGKGDLLHAKQLTVVEIGWHHVEYTYVDNGLYMCTRVYQNGIYMYASI